MLRFYNSLTRKKDKFRPRKDRIVHLFVCGPTVYDFSHLGHARTYLFFDALVNFLKWKGYKVFYLQNITDIDDKIIKRAKERNVSPKVLARKFEREYLKDMKSLKINSVTKYARATDYIPEIISQVKRLLKKGYAYQIKDGIYFDIKKFKDYGKLSRRTFLQAEDAFSRIDESVDKKNKGDFCLWKFSKKGEPRWKSPWGYGRPGWHIEDTAICEKHFGFQYDIHGGARDLIFPHHEAEIAQMEALSGKSPMVKYWLHTGFLTVRGKKMSKSLNNFITIRDFLENNSPEVLRMFFFQAHYRSPIDFSSQKVIQSRESLKRLYDFYLKIQERFFKRSRGNKSMLNEYSKILNDDFNTPEFFSAVFDLVKTVNKKITEISQDEASAVFNLFSFINNVFKIFPETSLKISSRIRNLLNEREKLRKKRKWKEADKIREIIRKEGFEIEDTPEGPKIKPIF